MSWLSTYDEYNQSSRFMPAYCSDDWDDGASTNLSSSTTPRGYRVSFNAVDSGWRRHASDESGLVDHDQFSLGQTFISSRVNTFSWKFCIHSPQQNQDCVDYFATVSSSDQDDGLEEHEICLRIIQYQPSEEPIMTVATVYCTKGIRPATSKHRKQKSGDSLHMIHSSTVADNSDCETLVDCTWTATPMRYTFEVMAYRQRSPMFRQYDLLINGKSFFDLPGINEVFPRRPVVNTNASTLEERETTNDRRNGTKSKQKVFPAKGRDEKSSKKQRESKSPRNETRSLSPFRSCGNMTSHRKGSSLIESPDCVRNFVHVPPSRNCRANAEEDPLIEVSESIDNDVENRDVNAMAAGRPKKETLKRQDSCALQIALSEIDQIPVSSTLASKDQSAIEADTLYFAYLFASKNAKSQHLSSPKCYTNRYEFVHRVMTEMMTLVLRGDVNGDTASRIVHCVATMIGFPVAAQVSNSVLLLEIPETETQCTLSKKLRRYGEVENMAIASGTRRFGVCTFRSGTDAAATIRASCRGDLKIKVRNLEYAFQNNSAPAVCPSSQTKQMDPQQKPARADAAKPNRRHSFQRNAEESFETLSLSNGSTNSDYSGNEGAIRQRTITLESFRDEALEAFRRGVENTVKDCEGMLSRAITMALLSIDSAPATSTLSPIDLEAKLLCAAEKIMQDAKSFQDRKKFLEEALVELAASVRSRAMKPKLAANIVHQLATLLDLRLFRQPSIPTVIVKGIQKSCTREDLESVLQQFGEIDAVGIADSGFGLVRWKNVASVGRVIRKLESGSITLRNTVLQVKSVGNVSFNHSLSSLKEVENGSCEECCGPSRVDKGCSCDLLVSPSSRSTKSISCEAFFEEDDQQTRKQLFNFATLGNPTKKGITSSPSGEKNKSAFASAVHKYRKWISRGVFTFLQASENSGPGTFSSVHSVDELLVVPVADREQSSSGNGY